MIFISTRKCRFLLSSGHSLVVLLAGLLTVAGGRDSTSAAPSAAPSLAAPEQKIKSTAQAAPLAWAKPAWLTDLSLGVKESYDDNVFLVSGDGAGKRDSWITTVSPKAGVNLAPWFGKESAVQTLTFGYAPEFVTFHDESSESFIAQRLATTLKAKTGSFDVNLESSLGFIDGSKKGHIWAPPDNVASAYAAAAVRERREQFQDRSKITLRYDWADWFVRPIATLLYYDLNSDLLSIPGYYNFCDRYDLNGGVDFGYKVFANGAITLGYRYGHQSQQQYPTAIDPKQLSSPSDYQRLLLGFEGKPWPWLTVALQGGPDFRTYPEDTPTHVTPVNDKHPIKYYGEASLIAEATTRDAVSFKYKQWQWLSSVGKLAIFESLYDLSYRRKMTSQLAFELGGRIQSADYTSGNVPASLRDDWQFTVPVLLTFTLNAHFSASLGYSLDLGRNAQDDVVQPRYREFNRQVVTLGAQFKF